MKKLMILGAAASQVPLISAAKRLGYETIVTSIPGDYPGFTYADVCCYADISKPEEVLAKAKRAEHRWNYHLRNGYRHPCHWQSLR